MQKKSKFQIRSAASKRRWVRDEVKEAEWRLHVEGWRSSGQSVRQYCMANFITESSFRAWRREIALRDREGADNTSVASPVAPFVPVRLVSPAADSSAGDKKSLQIQLPGGASVLVSDSSNLELIARLLTAMESK